MKKIIVCMLSLMLLLQGCNTTKKENQNEIVIALSSEPEEGFDPCLGWGRDGNPLVQSTLLSFDSEMNITYDLATSYTISDDGLTYIVTLRDDVLFSDGTKLTATDVVFTYETIKNSASVVDLTILDNVKEIDEYTVEFTLKNPQITFLNTLGQTGIVAKHDYDDDYLNSPIGSGPFTLLQWDKGEQVIFGVNEHYYGTKPTFTRVTVVFMNEDAAYNAALNGDVDVALTNSILAQNTIAGMELTALETIDNRGITLPTTSDEGLKNEYGYPIGNDVTSNIAIRQALSYGIDRSKLVDDALGGYGIPAYSECDGMPWASSESVVEYDKDYAIKLLENDGWVLHSDGYRYKDGLKANFTLLYNASDTTRQTLSFAIKDQAKELGIDIDLSGTSWDEIEKQMHSQAVLMGFGSQNPMETYMLYHSSNKGKDFYNPEYFDNKTVDEHLESALKNTDYNAFLEEIKLVQWDGETGVSTKGELPFLWLVNIDHLYFINENIDIKNQKIHPHGHSWPLLSNLNEWTWK